MSTVFASSFSWPAPSTVSVVRLTLARVVWYMSLVLAVAAVTVAIQQSLFLVRSHHAANPNQLLRELLNSSFGQRIPRWDQLAIWQAAVALLEWSIYFCLGSYPICILFGVPLDFFRELAEILPSGKLISL